MLIYKKKKLNKNIVFLIHLDEITINILNTNIMNNVILIKEIQHFFASEEHSLIMKLDKLQIL